MEVIRNLDEVIYNLKKLFVKLKQNNICDSAIIVIIFNILLYVNILRKVMDEIYYWTWGA
jgi:hypothetical protein